MLFWVESLGNRRPFVPCSKRPRTCVARRNVQAARWKGSWNWVKLHVLAILMGECWISIFFNHMASYESIYIYIYICIYDMFFFGDLFWCARFGLPIQYPCLRLAKSYLFDSFSEGMGILTVAMQTSKMFAPSLAPAQPDWGTHAWAVYLCNSLSIQTHTYV